MPRLSICDCPFQARRLARAHRRAQADGLGPPRGQRVAIDTGIAALVFDLAVGLLGRRESARGPRQQEHATVAARQFRECLPVVERVSISQIAKG